MVATLVGARCADRIDDPRVPDWDVVDLRTDCRREIRVSIAVEAGGWGLEDKF